MLHQRRFVIVPMRMLLPPSLAASYPAFNALAASASAYAARYAARAASASLGSLVRIAS